MSRYASLAELLLQIDSYGLDGLERSVSSAFTRLTTVVRLRGEGAEGVGEDVTYGEREQRALQSAGPVQPLAGTHTLAGFSELLDELELFPETPELGAYRFYRRWAFESAALDLALRQAGRSLAESLDLVPRPVTFVVSMRLAEPPSAEPVRQWLGLYPSLRFKLDPTSSWDDALFEELVETQAVEAVDLKGAYKGTVVDQPADPVLYARVAAHFPRAWIEDPDLTPETDAILAPHRDRITWDAPIHSVADIERLPFPPRAINVKPSRFGTLRALLAAYEYCDEHRIQPYGGGQFELGPGRGQIQYLASLFHPDAPNDVAPGGYNAPPPVTGLPESPLEPAVAPTGFRWTASA